MARFEQAGFFPFPVPPKTGDHWQEVSLAEACFLSLVWKKVQLEVETSRGETVLGPNPEGEGEVPIESFALGFSQTLVNDAPRAIGVGALVYTEPAQLMDERMLGSVQPAGIGFYEVSYAKLGGVAPSFWNASDEPAWRHVTGSFTSGFPSPVECAGDLFKTVDIASLYRGVAVPRARPCFELAADYGVTPTKWYVRPLVIDSTYRLSSISAPIVPVTWSGAVASEPGNGQVDEVQFLFGLAPFAAVSLVTSGATYLDTDEDGIANEVLVGSGLNYVRPLGEVGALELELGSRTLSWTLYGAASLSGSSEIESTPEPPPAMEDEPDDTTGPTTVTIAETGAEIDTAVTWTFSINLTFSVDEEWPFTP